MTDPILEIAEEMVANEYSVSATDINLWAGRLRAIASKLVYTSPCDKCGTAMYEACPKCDAGIINLSPERAAFMAALGSSEPSGQIISEPLQGATEAMAQALAEQVRFTDCSCEDGLGDCWYHLDDIQKARSTVLNLLRAAYRAMKAKP